MSAEKPVHHGGILHGVAGGKCELVQPGLMDCQHLPGHRRDARFFRPDQRCTFPQFGFQARALEFADHLAEYLP